MHIERQYRELEQIEEVKVYNIHKLDIVKDAPQVKKPEKVRFSNVMKHVPSDINVFSPIDNCEDFIIERLGWNLLQRINMKLEDVEGRKLSQISPFYYELLNKDFKEVYKTNETKVLRIVYYTSDKIQTLANIHILYDEGEIYLISDYKNTEIDEKSLEERQKENDENKANFIEYLSQTGSYYKSREKYAWTPGIYNIINRSKEPQDSFYNIIFDLVIPEDKPLVEE